MFFRKKKRPKSPPADSASEGQEPARGKTVLDSDDAEKQQADSEAGEPADKAPAVGVETEEPLADEDAAAQLLADQDADDATTGADAPASDADTAAAATSSDDDADPDAGNGDADAEGGVPTADEPEEEKPRARVTLLTMILCVFNILAACAFAFLLLMDAQKRQQWEYANRVQDLALIGVPLEEEEKGVTVREALRPPVILNQEQIATEFKSRKTGVTIPAKDFRDVQEVLHSASKSEKLSSKMMTDLFKGVEGEPVATLEQEYQSVRNNLIPDIEKAAQASAKLAAEKTAADQRQELFEILLPMATTTAQIDQEVKRIEADKDLKGMHLDAVQRRMCFELLRVFQMYRFWNDHDPVLADVVGAKPTELKRLKDAVNERMNEVVEEKSKFLGMNRDTYEKRDNIAFVMVAVANLRTPDFRLLYPRKGNEKGSKQYTPTRTEVVLGLVDYVKASNVLAGIVQKLDEMVEPRLLVDRDGIGFAAGGTFYYLPGFVTQYRERVQRLIDAVASINARESAIADLKQKLATTEELLKSRDQDYEFMKTKLLESRQITVKLVEQLRKLEAELFAAQKEMAGIIDVNQQLERAIAEAEIKVTKKGL